MAAGHDRFVPALFNDQMASFRATLGLTEQELLAYGRIDPNDHGESFTMTVLGLKLSRKANGVSALNGEVARRQWHHLFPDRPLDEVPIGHVTNGVWVVKTHCARIQASASARRSPAARRSRSSSTIKKAQWPSLRW